MTYQPKVYRKQGGDEMVVASGGKITVEPGGAIDFGAGATVAGAGVSAAETNLVTATRNGNQIKTEILIDLTGLVASTTDLDIIGDTGGAASANIGQITTAVNGLIQAGEMKCLEVPAGGPDDVDLYSATVGTGAQDGGIAALVETALVTSGAAWTSGAVKGMTALPAADEFLYLVNGEAGVPGTYTAGKFLLTFYGEVA